MKSGNSKFRHFVAASLCISLLLTLLVLALGWSFSLAPHSLAHARHYDVAASVSGNRIIVDDVKINGQPVRIALDTGAEDFVIFRPVAERLGLKFTNPPADPKTPAGHTPVGWTDPLELQIGASNGTTELAVADMSEDAELDIDGALGWAQLQDSFFTLDAVSGRLLSAARGNVPGPTSAWQQLPVRKKSDVLVLEIPGQNGQPGGIKIDTGSSRGVELAPAKWREWRAAHPTAPTTLDAYYMPLSAGLIVREVAWAEEVTIGPLTLTDVTVEEADPTFSAVPSYVATLGLAVLRRQTMVVDGERGMAYFSRQQIPPKPFQHNRLGALFVPGDRPHEPLVAHVAAGSPADEAGIRNGDVLLKVDGDDATKWQLFPYPKGESKFTAGTKLGLTLKRGDKEFTVTVTLRDILGPGLPPAGLSQPASTVPVPDNVQPQ